MNLTIRDRWIAALESGNYEQGAGRLRQGDKFCCLGVLCDIVAEEIGGRWKELNNNMVFVVDGEWTTTVLPGRIMDYTELEDDDPVLGNASATDLNDSGVSFNEIAKFI